MEDVGALGRRAARSLAVAAVVAGALLWIPRAPAAAPPTPWDGTNPFRCTIQDAGFGATVPDPAADPYCVHFDKTHQNIAEGGFVDFVSKEPARTAAASPKCFYFQEDHWRSSLVQTAAGPAVYEWVGHYFFDKATGDGGVWVSDFTFAGQTADPSEVPGFPPQYGRYYGPGTGGTITHNSVPADPRCVALAKRDPAAIYGAAASAPRCVPGAGHVDSRGIGPIRIGSTEARVRTIIGPPGSVRRGFLRYCVGGGGALLVGQPGDRSGTLGAGGHGRTVVVLTTSRAFVLRGAHRRLVRVGSTRRVLLRAFPHARALLRLGRTLVLRSSGRVLDGVRGGHVLFLAVYDRRAIRSSRALIAYLKRAG